MGSLGVPELIVIFVVALIFFGPKKLPELGRSLGKSINEFKKASNELRNTLDEEIRLDERRQAAPAAPALPVIDMTAQAIKSAEVAAAPEVTAASHEISADTVARGQHGS
jgi:sec-independent protein translocase protein TatA